MRLSALAAVGHAGRAADMLARHCWPVAMAALLACGLLLGASVGRAAAAPSLASVIAGVQPRMVKIYGAGGFRGLEAYQSGFLISPEGHVLTVWSYVLDTDHITVTLNDGRRYQAQLLGADPRLELAVLKIDAADLPYFDLHAAVVADEGTRVLAFSNLYGVATGDEPASVQQGIISAVATLAARRGAFETPYQGPIYVVDAMTNNPGAAGGALTDWRGRLLGMLGKELRNRHNNTWLNYAVPVSELIPSVEAIRSGQMRPLAESTLDSRPQQPLTLASLGLVLVPNILERTPPFVDEVRGGSAAERAGLRPDDLVVFVNGQLVQSCNALRDELARFEADEPVRLTILRDNELIEVELKLSR